MTLIKFQSFRFVIKREQARTPSNSCCSKGSVVRRLRKERLLTERPVATVRLWTNIKRSAFNERKLGRKSKETEEGSLNQRLCGSVIQFLMLETVIRRLLNVRDGGGSWAIIGGAETKGKSIINFVTSEFGRSNNHKRRRQRNGR